ncbi:type 1 glutamine amidotransferase family protein [Streptococcus dentiloxodontae]
MTNEILVYIFDDYADWEPVFICSELNNQLTSFQIKTISINKSPKQSMGGFRVLPDYSLSDYPKDFCLLIIPGGNSWLEGKNAEILPVVDFAVSHQIPVAAICAATNFLAENGYLDQVQHTGNTLAFMKQAAPHYQGEKFYLEKQAVRDKGIITANGTAALEFAKEIMLLLSIKDPASIDEWYRFNKLGFYPAAID